MMDIYKNIIDWNPWLESGVVPDIFLGYERDIDILRYLNFKEIKILQGARRVGKSTLLYKAIDHLIKKNKKVVYINFDDEVLKKYDLSTIIEKLSEKIDIDYLFIDEIQNCNNWSSYIRKAYDTHIFKQIWITGSNSSLIEQEYSSLLTGRNITLNITTLNFKEFLNFKGIKVDDINFISTQKLVNIKKQYNEYIQYGAFPEMALRDYNKKELLINYFNDFIYKDIVGRYNVNATKIKKLSLYLLSNTSKLFSYRKIANTLDLNIESLSDYLNYFYEIYLFDELKKFDYSYKKQLIGNKKIYSLDNGFINIGFSNSEDIGRKLENMVFIELKRRGYTVYYNNTTKKECDFLVFEDDNMIEAIQVTYSLYDDTTKKREIDGLLDAMSTYDFKQGYILTYEEEDTIKKDNKIIYVIPIWKWLLST